MATSVFYWKYWKSAKAMFGDQRRVQIKNYLLNYLHFEIKAARNYWQFVFTQSWWIVHFVSWEIILPRYQNGRRLSGSARAMFIVSYPTTTIAMQLHLHHRRRLSRSQVYLWIFTALTYTVIYTYVTYFISYMSCNIYNWNSNRNF